MKLGRLMLIVLVMVLLSACQPIQPAAAPAMNIASGSGIVRSVQKAPVVPDGGVAGRITDFVINLDVSLDPNVPGKMLAAGKSIRVTLPAEFANSQEPALADVGSAETCTPANLQCITGVLLQGWPQHPIAPPKYTWSYDGPNTLVVTAKEDLIPNPPLEPGIKQIHLMLLSFTNPSSGTYWVEVVAEIGPDGAAERGLGLLEIHEAPHPSINVTSVMNEGAPNTIYQTAAPGDVTPLPYDFLLWDRGGEPMLDVTVTSFTENHWLLTQGGRIVGAAHVATPPGAEGQRLFAETAAAEFNAPIFGIPAGHLRVFFQVGSLPGEYVATFRLLDGNAAQMIVNVDN